MGPVAVGYLGGEEEQSATKERNGMRKQRAGTAGLFTALVLMAPACGDEAEDVEQGARDVATTIAQGARQAATTVAGAAEGATRLKATLTGAAEVPGPGDPDGGGTATVNIDATKREVCYEVTTQKVDSPTAMHIHDGESGKSGPVVVPLTTPTGSDTTTKGCANADAALIGRMTANPSNFYVNVHSQAHQQGAVRGQLSQ